MSLTAEQIAQKKTDLQTLESAQLQLMAGELAVSTTIDGNSVTFQKIYPGKLEGYITKLKNELAPYDASITEQVREFTARNNRMFC